MEIHRNITGTESIYKHDLWANGMTSMFWLHVEESEHPIREGKMSGSGAAITLTKEEAKQLRDELDEFLKDA